MQKETVKVSDVVTAQIIGKDDSKDNDNKERKRTATETTDSDPDTGNSEDGMVGSTVRPDNPA